MQLGLTTATHDVLVEMGQNSKIQQVSAADDPLSLLPA
jgi:hypothetical protein